MFRWSTILILVFSVTSVRADELLYRYEGDVLPFDESAGWRQFDSCLDTCSTSLQDGHFILTWVGLGDQVNYTLFIRDDLGEPLLLETLWVEWNFRSDQELGPFFTSNDAALKVRYKNMQDIIEMYGDAAISFEGGDFVTGLDINEFHTYRFESLDGLNYTFAVDGLVFLEDIGNLSMGNAYLQMRGCGCEDGNAINEWDFVRYGTINDGEAIVASDPPEGGVDSHLFPGFDRFTITFDQPGYVFIDDVIVETTGGDTPTVIQTRRLDNGEPETLQIVLDRPLPVGETTTFTFNTGGSTNTVTYTYRLTGACCLSDDTCTITTNEECTNSAGTFHPDQPCSSLQACCLSDDTCQMLDPLCCEDLGGTIQNENSVCTAPVACCMDGICEDLDPLCCVLVGGTPHRDLIVCEGDQDGDQRDGSCGDFCPNDPNKIFRGFCGCGIPEDDSDLDTVPDCIDQCPGEDDRIDENNNGTPDCAEQIVIIPTVSQWGMVILTLLILITAKLTFGYQLKLDRS